MAEDQVATRPQVGTDSAQNTLLGRSVEIDDDIPAKHDVELSVKRKPFIHEIDAYEFYPFTQFLFYPYLRPVRVTVAEQVFFLVRQGHRYYAVRMIDSGHGSLEGMRGDVGSHDPVIKTGMGDAEFGEHHGEGIRFFAGSAPGGPE